ncbi:Bug family tripartite tricarboxylate transporter substrate binding protein [Alcaligenes faecalis]|uniref:Tripartite tricarboxylate transporter substrate binding protein n=1 Tax=Alcaligenes faecalis TaxID=511 RepID=A0AAE9H9D5_ALCFA|nr:tripartite tricarboxylate transporter substrate binding protein [Alcaligenes faecalis]UPL22239.1 tripartite tricarboxylate transporter substrate binding protein [Alcaligenes faecalis]
MKKILARKVAPLLAGMGLLFCSLGAQAAYPDKPIRLVVPFTPGGVTDVIARGVAQQLSKDLGQIIIVENKPGASGIIATDFVAKSAPDGYTVLLAAVGQAVVNNHLYKKLPYDPAQDLAAVSLVAEGQNVLVVNAKQSPFNTGEELINHARAKPDDLTYASFGNGSSSHLSAAAFTTMANIDVIHAPYRGSAPAMTDLLGGHISFMFDSMGTAITHINANTVRPLAVSGPERSSLLPEVPTFAELGLDQGYNVTAWFGFHVSSGTPTEIIDRLSQAMKTVSQNAEFVETFRRQGVDIISSTPAEYAEFLRQEDEKLGSLIKQANITLD